MRRNSVRAVRSPTRLVPIRTGGPPVALLTVARVPGVRVASTRPPDPRAAAYGVRLPIVHGEKCARDRLPVVPVRPLFGAIEVTVVGLVLSSPSVAGPHPPHDQSHESIQYPSATVTHDWRPWYRGDVAPGRADRRPGPSMDRSVLRV